MFLCSFCGNEHEDDREFCPETGDKIELCKCLNAECGKIIDTHFYDSPYCGTFQFDREAYLQQRSAELYEEAVNFSEAKYKGVHANDWQDTKESLYTDAAKGGHSEIMCYTCMRLIQLQRMDEARTCFKIFIKINPKMQEDKWVKMASQFLNS